MNKKFTIYLFVPMSLTPKEEWNNCTGLVHIGNAIRFIDSDGDIHETTLLYSACEETI
jgi:hypothetical protein